MCPLSFQICCRRHLPFEFSWIPHRTVAAAVWSRQRSSAKGTDLPGLPSLSRRASSSIFPLAWFCARPGRPILIGYIVVSEVPFRCLKHPQTTIIGYENHNKRAWVERMMQAELKDRGLALSVIGSNVTAATFLSSTSIALSSLIGAWVGGSSNNIMTSSIIYGDTKPGIISVKYVSLLTCFLLAFASFIQSARNFVHANLLISMPNTDIPVDYLQKVVIRGGTFWSVGLRALYFATTLLLWIFGPIPMFLCSVFMVVVLHMLDMNSTQMYPYQPTSSHNVFKKIGEEISIVTRAFEHHERSGEHGNKTEGAHQ